MGREIQLDGGDVTVLKALGTGGSEVSGATLMEKVPSMDAFELIAVLKGLMLMGYIDADKRSCHSEDELKSTNFHVNSGYSRDLREALDPTPEPRKSKRVRRE